jgi:hypothetical protein
LVMASVYHTAAGCGYGLKLSAAPMERGAILCAAPAPG